MADKTQIDLKDEAGQVETLILDEESGDAADDFDEAIPHNASDGSDRDYYTKEFLTRFFNLLKQNNPKPAEFGPRTVIPPPQVLYEGTNTTVLVNFMDLCRIIRRQTTHVQIFLLAELGTIGYLDGQQRLVVEGRFSQKKIEWILDQYIYLYVGCKGRDSEMFGYRRSVIAINAGFVARSHAGT